MIPSIAFAKTVLAAFVIALALPGGARSAGVEDFYRGRTVSLIIG